MKLIRTIIGALPVAAGLITLLLAIPSAGAYTTVPLQHAYNGHLLDSSGNAITTAVEIRFSYWKSADFVSSDITGTGAINTGAANYANWYEEHTLTPDANGYFSVELGSITSLPAINEVEVSTLLNMFLQTEVKAAAAADTAYELLDINPSVATDDRSPILSVPFAQNADFIDQREIGDGSGSIVILGSGATFPVYTIPGGTNQNNFIIDADGSASGNVTLQFGGDLNKTLTYEPSNTWFNFNDDVNIQGNLTVTGLINGININNLVSTQNQLKVSSGGGLTAMIEAGNYRLNGTITNFTGTSGVVLPASSTVQMFFTSTGLTVTTAGFPTDKSFIPLAVVTTNGSTITAISDRRALQSDDRETTLLKVMNPEYDGVSYSKDGSNNVGQLVIMNDVTTGRNFYRWSTTLGSLQDYDVVLRIPLAQDFIRWKANPFTFAYRTGSSSAANNRVDISVFDTAGVAVSLSGATTSLANTSWTTTNFTYTGNPTWAAEGDMLVKFKVSSSGSTTVDIAEFKMESVHLLNP